MRRVSTLRITAAPQATSLKRRARPRIKIGRFEMNNFRKFSLIAGSIAGGLTLSAVVALGTVGIASAIDSPYSVNAQGQTYGSAIHASSPEQEPDLIAATATNGKDGFVLKSDLDVQADSPESAAQITKQSDAGFEIGVYLSDGKTRVGSFLVGGETAESSQSR